MNNEKTLSICKNDCKKLLECSLNYAVLDKDYGMLCAFIDLDDALRYATKHYMFVYDVEKQLLIID